MTATSSATAPQIQGGNQFTFNSEDGSTQIVLSMSAIGPLKPGQTIGPRLDYTGDEGHLTFSADQLQIEDSSLGTLVTVNLKLNNDTGGIKFTIVMPVVRGASLGNPVDFETVGIKTRTLGFIDQTGAQSSYCVMRLDSVAQVVEFAL